MTEGQINYIFTSVQIMNGLLAVAFAFIVIIMIVVRIMYDQAKMRRALISKKIL